MEFVIIISVMIIISAVLAYRYQVLDYFVYIAAVVSGAFGMIWIFVTGDYVIGLLLMALGLMFFGIFFLFRYLKFL